jgi:hypothetical protein
VIAPMTGLTDNAARLKERPIEINNRKCNILLLLLLLLLLFFLFQGLFM